MAPDRAPRFEDLSPIRQRIFLAALAARDAKFAELARFEAGDMCEAERTAYLDRMRRIRRARSLAGEPMRPDAA
jgi:hypothetical protein